MYALLIVIFLNHLNHMQGDNATKTQLVTKRENKTWNLQEERI